jgi:hypothetical protein
MPSNKLTPQEFGRVILDATTAILHIDRANMSDNFVNLGGDSLSAEEVAEQVCTRTGIELDGSDIIGAWQLLDLLAFAERGTSADG